MEPPDRLLAEIEADARETGARTGRPVLSPKVLAALRRSRRAAFIPAALAASAHENAPQPIGHGQTISQPFVVALMTDLLDLEPNDRVLEVGTGSGYQAAILAMLAREVWTVEAITDLADQARRALAAEAIGNVEVRVGDGAEGWPEHAPYDAVIVTAAARAIPPALIQQLASPGRMVIPVGSPHAIQQLTLIEKRADGITRSRTVLDVAFVPLTSPSLRVPGAGG